MRSGGQLGQMESFDVTASDWTAYKERLTSFLIVNKVPDSDKVHAFLSIIGPRTYGLLKSLAAPDLPSGKSFEQLKSLLDAHLAPKPSTIGERAKFYRRAQHEGESLPEYVAELRKLSQSCQFGANLDEALRDRFVCGLLREDVQRVLFTEDDKLTFPRAVERALAMEAARKNVAETRVVESVATQLHKMEGECNYDPADLYEAQAISGKQRLACYRCGSPSHTHSVCPHVNNTCYKCGKKGHIQRACRSNGQYCGGYQQKRRVKTLKVVTQVPPIGVSEQVASGRTPIFVGLKIDGALVEMELDTGAAVSIMPYKQFKQQFPSARCGPTDIVLRTYTGALVQPCGVAVVKVQHGEQTAKLPLYLVDQAGPPLLGREWLRTVRLNWNQILGLNHVSRSVFDLSSRTKERLESLLEKYKMLFKDELGAITDERAELFFKADHRPRFLKARNVPFALQSAVEAEIEKLVQLGILTPVNTSEYATPAVPLLRKDAPWCWDDCCRDAFNEVKRMLSSPQVLAHYDPDRPLKLACDASQYGFTSEEFKQFVREMGCRHVQTAPYNPSTNGLAERFVQTLKNALKKDDVHQPMKVKLNKFLLAYRNTPHATTHEAPANLLLGRRLRTRLDVLKPAVGERVAYNQFRQTVNRQCRVRDVSVGDHVLARNYRGQPKWVPAVVMAQSGPVSFRVRASTSSGCFEWRRHKNQLLQGTAGLAEDVAQDDGFSVWPQSDTEPEPAPSLPAARVSPSPPTLLTDTSRGDLDRRYPLRNRRPPDWF
ncbi:uncharacterized protein LOC119165415 [Rhipicephalus microplus]|uniref:uncharacterized protein LOC119165415 n=1 Tax=Rhipicephalus microplus TaxID=6941 RepID=UPI003F6A7EEF